MHGWSRSSIKISPSAASHFYAQSTNLPYYLCMTMYLAMIILISTYMILCSTIRQLKIQSRNINTYNSNFGKLQLAHLLSNIIRYHRSVFLSLERCLHFTTLRRQTSKQATCEQPAVSSSLLSCKYIYILAAASSPSHLGSK